MNLSIVRRTATGLAFGILCTIFAVTCQAVVRGSQERTDWSVIQGWACDDAPPSSEGTRVYLFTTVNGFWTQIGNATADRYRADIGRTGACTGGAYHGFVFTDLPQSLVNGEVHFVHAYAYSRATGMVLLANSPQVLESAPRGLWDDSLVNGRWRTDYPSNRLGTVEEPISMDKDASGKCFLWTAPEYLMAGASFESYRGPSHECLTSPDTYERSNAASSESTHVTDNFWVVTVNVEQAYDAASECISGPPNQSVPISAPGTGLVSLVALPDVASGAPTRKKAHLILNTSYDNCRKIPFLSYGLHSGFGNGGNAPIAVLRDRQQPTELRFAATLLEMAPGQDFQNAAYVFVEAIWGGRKRWAYIYLLGRNLSANLDRQRFNWNIRESVWFPGADIVYREIAQLNSECAWTAGWMPLAPPLASIGERRTYAIDLESLFACLGSSRFSEPIPPSGPIPVTGIHFAIEQGPARNNWTHIAFDSISLSSPYAMAAR